MYLIIDFGLTRTVNKIKKKAWKRNQANDLTFVEAWDRAEKHSLDALDKLRTGNVFGKKKAGEKVYRGSDRYIRRFKIRIPAVARKYNSGERVPRSIVTQERIPDGKNYTDVRKVDDYALSPSGYMGFKNTPNSFFEEAIPMKDMIKIGKKTKVKPTKFY